MPTEQQIIERIAAQKALWEQYHQALKDCRKGVGAVVCVYLSYGTSPDKGGFFIETAENTMEATQWLSDHTDATLVARRPTEKENSGAD